MIIAVQYMKHFIYHFTLVVLSAFTKMLLSCRISCRSFSSFLCRSLGVWLALNSTRWIMSSMQSSKSVNSLMCGGGRFDLNPYVSLLLSFASWSFKKKKALQRMQWIRDSALFISCCRNVFLLPSGVFLVEYSKSFT